MQRDVTRRPVDSCTAATVDLGAKQQKVVKMERELAEDRANIRQ